MICFRYLSRNSRQSIFGGMGRLEAYQAAVLRKLKQWQWVETLVIYVCNDEVLKTNREETTTRKHTVNFKQPANQLLILLLKLLLP